MKLYAIFVGADFRYDEAALSTARRIKIAGIKSAEAKNLSAAADIALDRALKGAVNGYASPPDLSYDAQGRPRVPGAFISLSHTRGLAACAISDRPVGLDVEWERPMDEKLARRILSNIEMKEFAAQPDKSTYLLMKWVAKEAYLKLTGEGIAGGMHKYTEANGVIRDVSGAIRAHIARPNILGYHVAVCQNDSPSCQLFLKK